jgi:hypothetical protein
MREAAVPGYRLSKSKRSTRVLTTLGLTGLFLALITACVLTTLKSGLAPSQVASYYRGSTEVIKDADALMSSEPRSIIELAEITHFHLFGGSILLFLLCHLLSLCDVSENLRITLYVSSFAGMITFFTLPWLIAYHAAWWAWGYTPAMVIMVTSIATLYIFPLREMWGRK